jgi:hypothetical protein
MRSSSFWSGFRTSSRNSDTTWTSSERSRALKPTADPREDRRLHAEIRSTAAKLVLTRKKAEDLRDTLVERDTSQAEVSAATSELIEELAAMNTLSKEILEAIAGDLGDIQVEVLRVTR